MEGFGGEKESVGILESLEGKEDVEVGNSVTREDDDDNNASEIIGGLVKELFKLPSRLTGELRGKEEKDFE